MFNRIFALLRTARITLVDDTGPVRLVQIDEGDYPGGRRIIDKVPHVQEFGFTSSPPLESDALLGAPCGDRSQSLVIGTNHKESRPRDLTAGDSCLYSLRGQRVWLTED